jgi:hypothetical protein
VKRASTASTSSLLRANVARLHDLAFRIERVGLLAEADREVIGLGRVQHPAGDLGRLADGDWKYAAGQRVERAAVADLGLRLPGLAKRALDRRDLLGWIERTGNRLPDPVFMFLWLIAALIVISVFAALLGWSAIHPTEIDEATGAPVIIAAVQPAVGREHPRLWVDMPATFTHFHPLGYVLVVMLGAGVAERRAVRHGDARGRAPAPKFC